MREHLLIDGNNVIGATTLFGPAPDFEHARAALVHRAHEYAQFCQSPVTVFFDGGGDVNMFGIEQGDGSLIRVVFSGPAEADTLIERQVYAAKQRTHVLVVSNDRRLQGFVRGLGARAASVAVFEQMLQDTKGDITGHVRGRPSPPFGQDIRV